MRQNIERTFARASLILLACVAVPILLTAPAQAQSQNPSHPSGQRMVAAKPVGGLRLRTLQVTADEDQSQQPKPTITSAPLVASDIRIDIAGPLARTRIRQIFLNTSSDWVEGVYSFPLPSGASIDSLRMVVGERVIEGVVKERGQARRIYEAARRSGRQGGLVSQERPNLFTASVANIAPNARIAIEIQFQERLRLNDGGYSLRFPLVVAPRYIPQAGSLIGVGGLGWRQNNKAVPDAERITPPLRHPTEKPGNPVTFAIYLHGDKAPRELRSASHDIHKERDPDGSLRITLAQGAVPADRDFTLTWRPATGRQTDVMLFKETIGKDTYLLAMVQPPQVQDLPKDTRPREMIFIIDTSGSMSGVSMDGAKAALKFALDRLAIGDRFNIIRFSSDASMLFEQARAANAANLAQAQGFVDALQAGGGTEMLPALRLALDGRIDGSRLRQIVFLTDGSVGNEFEILSTIRRDIGDSRLFTVGIGSAPNGYLMRKSAAMGRGSYTFIADEKQTDRAMRALFKKLQHPVLADLNAHFQGASNVDMYPIELPDLYAGEPVVLSARLSTKSGGPTKGGSEFLRLRGRLGALNWSREVALADAREVPGIARLWARDKIADLMDQGHAGGDVASLRAAVLKTALRYNLLSRYTSLVAVDVTPARPLNAGLTRHAVPINPPHGWAFEKLFPPRPAGLQEAAAQKRRTKAANNPTARPAGRLASLRANGATQAQWHLALGLGLLFLALGGFALAVLLSRRGRESQKSA